MKLLQDWNDELKDTESTAFKALSVRFETEVKTRNVFYFNAFLAELPRGGVPLQRYIGNLWKQENLVMKSCTPERPSVHPLHVSRRQMSGYFGGKTYGQRCLAKQRQLKSQ